MFPILSGVKKKYPGARSGLFVVMERFGGRRDDDLNVLQGHVEELLCTLLYAYPDPGLHLVLALD